MGNYAFLVYIGCIIMIIIIGKIFIVPFKKIFKLIFNSIMGGVLIYIINIIGSNFNFHIGINWGTILCSGILGIPGVILIVLLKLFQ
ncbi:MAG: pro-sigmaK processing inhibitor BofA family protein [Clostridia bacterium]|nr:pro-sigmaK processing inhibitor BofA family protein [Clostridia bacterium]